MGTHVIMKKSLAKALMDAGVEHFDSGGTTQGGIGGFLTPQNQFEATAPVMTHQSFQPRIGQLQGQQSAVYGQQQNLAKALLAQSQGQGPNPAQAALNQNTGNNVANSAALIASARGAQANPGLVARQAAEAGANAEQQAVGQAATLQAEQQLGAENQLSGLYGNEAGQALQGESIEQSGQAAQNSADTTGQLGASQINAGIAQQNANNTGGLLGGLIGGVGSVLGAIFNQGGEVQKLADGGIATYATPVDPRIVLNVQSSDDMKKGLASFGGGLGKALKSKGGSYSDSTDSIMPNVSLGADTSLQTPDAGSLGIPGTVGAAPAIPELMPSSASGLVAPSLPGLFADGGAIDFRPGGNVPGEAKVSGDSPENDTVPALVSPGEEVLPRSVTMAPDAPERAKRFVEALQESRGESDGYKKVLRAKATLKDRVAHLEKLCMGGRAA